MDYRSLFLGSPNAYMVLDLGLRYVDANPAYLHLTASKLEEIRGQHVFAAFPNDPEDPANASRRLVEGALQGAISTKKPVHLGLVPYRVPKHTPEGIVIEERYWSLSHFPVLDAAGNVTHVAQFIEDVTEVIRLRNVAEQNEDAGASRVQAEHGIVAQARRVQDTNVVLGTEVRELRALFEQAPGFICWLSGPQHVFQLANRAYHQIVGHRQLLGRSAAEAMPEVVEQGFIDLLDRVFKTGEPFIAHGLPIKLQREPNGPLEESFLDFVYQPIIEADGTVSGIFVEGNDRTHEAKLADAQRIQLIERAGLYEREKAARAEAEEANRLKDEFLATVSHELRTPLTSMLGWVQMLRAGQLPPERTGKALETIERNARAQNQLIEDLLDIARITSGKLKLEVETIEVASAIEGALESVRPGADAKEQTFRVALDSSASIRGDLARIQQVAWNLLANAVKFTPKGGRISVSLERVESSVELTVSDSGKGIEKDFLPFVFDRFRQAEGSSTRAHGGLGLGLTIVKHLVELHGGSITVSSEGAGRGATFRVRFPMAATRTTPPFGVQPVPLPSTSRGLSDFMVPPELAGLKVLIVDDEADTRELLEAILERCGSVVKTAGSVAEALAVREQFHPDLLLSDIGMPGEDGYALIHKVREAERGTGSRVPAVALTAFARAEDRTRALRAGFMAHVPKPVEPSELVAVLGALAPRTAD